MGLQTFTAIFIQYDHDIAYFRGLKDKNNNLLNYLFAIEITFISDLIGKLIYECEVAFEAVYMENEIVYLKNMRIIRYHD